MKCTKYVQITKPVVDEIAKYVRDGLSLKDACALCYVSYETANSNANKPDSEIDYYLAIQVAHARAYRIQWCLKRLRALASVGEKRVCQAQVKACESLLYALDERFRRDEKSGGTVVVIVDGTLRPVEIERSRISEVTVITPQLPMPAKTTQLTHEAP